MIASNGNKIQNDCLRFSFHISLFLSLFLSQVALLAWLSRCRVAKASIRNDLCHLSLSEWYASLSLSLFTEGSFHGDFPVPPPYSVATSLPTYDEAEKAKAASMAVSAVEVVPRVCPRPVPETHTHTHTHTHTRKSLTHSLVFRCR